MLATGDTSDCRGLFLAENSLDSRPLPCLVAALLKLSTWTVTHSQSFVDRSSKR